MSLSGSPSSEHPGGPPAPDIDPDTIPTVEHGGEPPGHRAPSPVDLSLSTNPYGPPPYFGLAIERGRREVAAYPDPRQVELTQRIEAELHLDRDEVLPAGSASELLRIAIAAYGVGRPVLLAPFTYGEYGRVAASVGASVTFGPMPGLLVDPESWADLVVPSSLVVLANPATPTGQYLTPRELAPLLEAVGRRHALLLVDESYLPFVPGARSVTGSSENLLTVFSWSKMLGTPGLPLGHATGSQEVLRVLRGHILPWSVGPFARHLGLLALERPAWARASLAAVERTAAEVRRQLQSRSRTHYFTVRSRSGSELARVLADRGFRVRDLSSLGLVEQVRFAVRRPVPTRAFLTALAEALSETAPEPPAPGGDRARAERGGRKRLRPEATPPRPGGSIG